MYKNFLFYVVDYSCTSLLPHIGQCVNSSLAVRYLQRMQIFIRPSFENEFVVEAPEFAAAKEPVAAAKVPVEAAFAEAESSVAGLL